MAALGAERASLAQQNAALAAALGDKLAGVAAAGEAHAGLAAAQQQQQGAAAEAQQQPGQPSPAQLRELGALLQRLTRENASLIKARWGFVFTCRTLGWLLGSVDQGMQG
jgi:hypothetical protein